MKNKKNEFCQEIPDIFVTDIDELLDFIKYKKLIQEFVDWKFKR